MRNSYIGQAWLVIVLSRCFGGALAGVQALLQERIAANKLAETLGQIPLLVPGASTGKADTISGHTAYRALALDQQIGWVIPWGGRGFADRIELLVGLDAAGATITGLYVLEQKETPGLGNKIMEAQWRQQFAGLSALGSLQVSRGPRTADNQVDAITGATISSESVCAIVNQALDRLRPELSTQALEEQVP